MKTVEETAEIIKNIISKEEIEKAISVLTTEGSYFIEDHDNPSVKSYYVGDIADSHRGIYMADKIMKVFNLSLDTEEDEDNDYLEEKWDLIDSFSSYLSDQIHKTLELPEDVSVSFGFLEGDGSYGVFVNLNFWE